MARPIKSGLDYFPLDVDIDKDDDIEFLEGKYGVEGFSLLIKIYMKIYGDKGYYMESSEKNLIILAKRTSISLELATEMVSDFVTWGIFNTKLFNEYKILTSLRVQKTYMEATSRRKIVEIIKHYSLLTVVNDNINLTSHDVNVNTMLTLIPKGKERKGNRKNNIIATEGYSEIEKIYPMDNSNSKQKKQAILNYNKLIESGITSDKLLACVKNYVKMLDDGSISSVWAISNFFGQKAYWKRYIYNFPQALLEAWKDALCIVEWKPIELENLKKLVDAGCLSRHARAALAEGKGYFHGIGSTDGLNKVMKQRGLDQSLKQKSNKLPPLVFKGGNYPI